MAGGSVRRGSRSSRSSSFRSATRSFVGPGVGASMQIPFADQSRTWSMHGSMRQPHSWLRSPRNWDPCVAARRNLIGSDLERRYPVVGSAIRWAERFATLVTANSAAVAGSCVARGHDRSRIRLTPNGHLDLPPLPMPGPTRRVRLCGELSPREGTPSADRCARAVTGRRMAFGHRWRRRDPSRDPGARRPRRHARAGHVSRRDRRRPRVLAGPTVAMLLSDSEGMPNALRRLLSRGGR